MAKTRNSKITKVLSLVLALIFILGAFTGCGGNEEEPTTTEPITTEPPTTTEPAPTDINPLTGEKGYDEQFLNTRPICMVIENSPAARPQWGLTSADITWEMVAEGGITRMVLMFANASRIPEKIGPVRSARPYFVQISEGFNANFIHFGGSDHAYELLNGLGETHMDGRLGGGAYFSRDKSRNVATEHTAYTSSAKVEEYFEDANIDTTIEEDYKNPFKFNEKAVKLEDGACETLDIMFSSSYKYTYTFDEEDGVYYSKLNGNAFKSDDGTQQNFSNIIILYTDIWAIGGAYTSAGYQQMDLSGGKGIYVSNGTYQEITWKKGNTSDMMKFYDADGEELKLNPGRSYVGIIDKGNESYTTIK